MRADVIQVSYEEMGDLSRQMMEISDAQRALGRLLGQQVDRVKGGVWLGEGARSFLAEMEGVLLPALGRVALAFETCAETAGQIARGFQSAEGMRTDSPTKKLISMANCRPRIVKVT